MPARAADTASSGERSSASSCSRRPDSTHLDCECGSVEKAASDDELVAKVEAHVASDHPKLVGKLTRDDVLGMAVEGD